MRFKLILLTLSDFSAAPPAQSCLAIKWQRLVPKSNKMCSLSRQGGNCVGGQTAKKWELQFVYFRGLAAISSH